MRDQHLKGTDSLEALAGWIRESCWARPEHTVWGGQVCSSQREHNTADLHFTGVTQVFPQSRLQSSRLVAWRPLGRLTSLCRSVIRRACTKARTEMGMKRGSRDKRLNGEDQSLPDKVPLDQSCPPHGLNQTLQSAHTATFYWGSFPKSVRPTTL